MKFVEKMLVFLKKLLKKQDKVVMLEKENKPIVEENKIDFRESLKSNIAENKVEKLKKISVLECCGDGLGIENDTEY